MEPSDGYNRFLRTIDENRGRRRRAAPEVKATSLSDRTGWSEGVEVERDEKKNGEALRAIENT